jgi:hypothetical protein
MKLTAFLRLVPNLRMCGSIPPVPHLYCVVLKHRGNLLLRAYVVDAVEPLQDVSSYLEVL